MQRTASPQTLDLTYSTARNKTVDVVGPVNALDLTKSPVFIDLSQNQTLAAEDVCASLLLCYHILPMDYNVYANYNASVYLYTYQDELFDLESVVVGGSSDDSMEEQETEKSPPRGLYPGQVHWICPHYPVCPPRCGQRQCYWDDETNKWTDYQ